MITSLGFPASRVIPLGPVRQRSTSPGRALPGLDRTQYRFGVQKRQSSFRMGKRIEPGWWLPPQNYINCHKIQLAIFAEFKTTRASNWLQTCRGRQLRGEGAEHLKEE
ncbi:hypothetical protein F2Q68_00040055 [Brassica cretica]|uniref:Uncharacterized protein n=1 Tax=Brassica cretica TaxID=69181 RepID=A0A8S9MG31_BRACR|nr:hypothetical protein F2Q68_00040055 [Brassica cretica]